MLELSGSIESDHYRSDLLRTLIKRQDVQDGQFNKLMDACAKMESDHYKTTIFQDILKSSNLSDTKMVVVLNSAKHVDSDHYLNEILLTAAPRVKSGNQALKDAYRQAAKEIDSETYYGRALRAIE